MVRSRRGRARLAVVPTSLCVLLAAGCASDAATVHTVDTVDVEESRGLHVAVASNEGDLVLELTFSGAVATFRGGYYEVIGADGTALYLANTDGNSEAPATYYVLAEGPGEILDYGAMGPGPEHLTVPSLPAGEYQLCSANRLHRVCTGFAAPAG